MPDNIRGRYWERGRNRHRPGLKEHPIYSEDGESKLVLYFYFLLKLFLHFTTMLTFLMYSFNYVTIGLKTLADSPLVNQVQTSQLGNGKDSKPSMIWSYSMQRLRTQALELGCLDSSSFSINC